MGGVRRDGGWSEEGWWVEWRDGGWSEEVDEEERAQPYMDTEDIKVSHNTMEGVREV